MTPPKYTKTTPDMSKSFGEAILYFPLGEHRGGRFRRRLPIAGRVICGPEEFGDPFQTQLHHLDVADRIWQEAKKRSKAANSCIGLLLLAAIRERPIRSEAPTVQARDLLLRLIRDEAAATESDNPIQYFGRWLTGEPFHRTSLDFPLLDQANWISDNAKFIWGLMVSRSGQQKDRVDQTAPDGERLRLPTRQNEPELTIEDLRAKMQLAFEQSELTLEEVGVRMGIRQDAARQVVSKLLKQIKDPRISTLIKFAEALNRPLFEIFAIPIIGQPKKQ